MSLFIFILTSYGMTKILTKESIFGWLRKLFNFKPFTCGNCMSVWIGFILSFLFPPIYSILISWFIYGMISYSSFYIIDYFIKEIDIIL